MRALPVPRAARRQSHRLRRRSTAGQATGGRTLFMRFAVKASGGDAARVGPALTCLGLDGRLRDTPVVRLSAGQRRRAALAVLVARSPSLWLLDEPHAGLDAEHRDLLDGIVRQAQAD